MVLSIHPLLYATLTRVREHARHVRTQSSSPCHDSIISSASHTPHPTMSSHRKQDSIDKLLIFLAKRDGIDKLVKTFQYLSKLAHWHLQIAHPSLATRAKSWEVSSGLSRKAFRTGRFLTGFNLLRTNPGPNWRFQLLAILANGGEMVYFFFDHLLWLSRIGVIDTHLATRLSFISAFGEAIGYVFFIVADLIYIRQGLLMERKLQKDLKSTINSLEIDEAQVEEQVKQLKERIASTRKQRVMQLFAISANLADLTIAIAEIEPNPFCNHAVTLGISGLVSAWSGWYRNWPASS